jgi:DNA-directed RNA polymerase specialized sigma subunit
VKAGFWYNLEMEQNFCMMDEPILYDLVIEEFEHLGDTCKRLLQLFYFEHKSWDLITEIMGYSTAASARNQKYKCDEKIRKNLV